MKTIITIISMTTLTTSAFPATNVINHVLPDRSLYTGEIAHELPQGFGRISCNNNTTFIGVFDPQPTFGIMNWPNGGVYLGEVTNGQMGGIGCLVSAEGLIYSGQFKDGKSEGFGTGIHTNYYYSGEWKNGKMEGRGAIQWANGKKYVGDFRDMKCHGVGTIWFLDGCLFIGQFVDGDIDGEGTKYYPDGTSLTGMWKKDQFLRNSIEPAATESKNIQGPLISDVLLSEMRIRAEKGDVGFQQLLGQASYHGTQGVPVNKDEAIRWFRKAAEQGDAYSQNGLGVMYHKGDGVSQDYAKAANLYLKSAEQGLAIAQDNIGVLFRDGQGVDKNEKEAFRWFLSSAQQGYPDGQNNVAVMYANGRGTETNRIEAMAWWILAVLNSNELAKVGISMLNKDMTLEDRNIAEQRARAIKKQISATFREHEPPEGRGEAPRP